MAARSNGDTAARRCAAVLVNLGTPDAPSPRGVRAFLRRFLSDPRVVELPRILWLPILYLFILPLRPLRVARLYRKIWGARASPLGEITAEIAVRLGEKWREEDYPCRSCHAMCYSAPRLAHTLDELAADGVQKLLLLPMYPQYSGTTTAAVYDQLCAWVQRQRVLPELFIVPDYHDHPLYIGALAHAVRRHWRSGARAKRLLLSFHGLPRSCVARGDPYASQCMRTAQLLASELGLGEAEWQLAFQSRFGAARWVQPYTDEVLMDWGRAALESVDVFCPGFAVDCLETLEEIAITNRELFRRSGGGAYNFIPCLNSSSEQIELFSALVRERLGKIGG